MPPYTDSLPPLIPRQILFGNPQRTSPQISPDGKYLSYIAPDSDNILQVWVRTLGRADDRMVTRDKKRGIHSYFWTFARETLAYGQDSDGDEDWHLFGVDLAAGTERDLTPMKGIQANVVGLSPERPGEALVSINHRDPALHDVYRLDLASGELALIEQNPGNVIAWTADSGLRVRAAVVALPDGSSELLLRRAPEQEWQTFRRFTPDEFGSPLGFSRDGRTFYIWSNHDSNAVRLIAYDLASGTEKVVVADPVYDVMDIVIHPLTRQVQAAGFLRERLEWRVLDPSIAGDFAALEKVRPGELRTAGRDLADKTWLAYYATDDSPGYYYLYDRESKQATLLFSDQPKLEDAPLVPMEPISLTSRDGLTLCGYLSLPKGVPAKDLPTVLFVHGGPWARDTWGMRPSVQWLANRGYAVLQINFRGSIGYGKAFTTAAFREWGGKMHDDLIDGVRWLVARGIADPKRIAIMGFSYGGYATLVGMTFTPEIFAAGVDIVGPSNLISFIRSIPPYWTTGLGFVRHRVGDVDTEEEFLKSRSPFFFVDRIRSPLLIAHGKNDPLVKQSESEQIVQSMRTSGKPVEYVLYTDEGHWFARPENNLHFYGLAEEFLAKYLGGRYAPATDVPGNSAVFK